MFKTLATISAAVLCTACGGSKSTTATSTPAPTTTTTAGDTTPATTPATSDPAAPAPTLRGQALADSIMAQWQREHPDRNWEEEVRRSHPNIPAAADNSAVIGVERGQGEGQTYGRYTEKDVMTWKRETERLVLAGARIFHDAGELGSTVAVSCDMCHPDAANTHPETYPKFQVQMGRVAHLRDMINWCLINPLRAEAWEADDFRMRAMEAYIIAQRKGTKLEFGKH